MGQALAHFPALPLLCAFSRHPSVLDWARRRASETWGPIALASEPFDFQETAYYEPTMGPDLKKVFWVFEHGFDPAGLAQAKLLTNAWEHEIATAVRSGPFESPGTITDVRPLNLDPGYLTVAKLVLASTKDHTHRIYLRDGIYAEITLFYRHGRWEHHEWTFPDYRRADYQAFFTRCRDWLKAQK
jgi:uncharacterized protein DUF4416